MSIPRSICVTEVGMRDGFQNEKRFVPTDLKVAIAEGLIAAGVRRLEITSFVSPKAVPQLSDAAEVVSRVRGRGASLLALTPNRRGAERAIEAGVDEIVAFVSASQSHNRSNINRSVEESLAQVSEMAAMAAANGVKMHGAIATAFGCPFEGDVGIEAPLAIAAHYASVGINDVTLGDTTGMATPAIVARICRAFAIELPDTRLTLHFHNTRGIAMANVMTGLELGIDRYESAVGGLGGCPFAPGATGNICSEDLVFLLQGMGLATGIDLEALIGVSHRVEAFFERVLPGQVMKAGNRLSSPVNPGMSQQN
jgi:hydroxymethylglutaryl-CoA lyase